jgi:hypothetical protein
MVEQLEPIYSKIRTRDNWKQMFLLQYQHANMNRFAQSLHNFSNDYVQWRRKHFDPRFSKLRRWILEAMITDSYYYRRLSHIGTELADTFESLIEITKALPGPQNSKFGAEIGLLQIEPELRGLCKDVRSCLLRLNEDMDNNLKLLGLARNVSQTRSVKHLTIIATIFLPLSVSAGFLSMQTRFKDLRLLIYDFFGVVVLLITFAIFCLVVLRFAGLIKKSARALTQLFLVFSKQNRRIVVIGAFLCSEVVILTSFLVGMFKDASLGNLLLGYGLVGIWGGLSVLVGINHCCTIPLQCLDIVALSSRRKTACPKTENDKDQHTGNEGFTMANNIMFQQGLDPVEAQTLHYGNLR